MSQPTPPRALPPRPDLQWYRKSAKRKLAKLGATNPRAQLATAQLAVARQHGFSSWRSLKQHVDAAARLSALGPPLVEAIRRKDTGTVRKLLTENPALVNLARGKDGESLLHAAAEADTPNLIDALIRHGADPNVKWLDYAHTPLSWAITCRSMKAADALVRAGVKPDLFCAAGMGKLDIVRTFFTTRGELKPNASQTGSSRYTPDGTPLPRPPESAREIIADALYIAARGGQAAVVAELLQHDPELAFRAYTGGTPLHWAYFAGSRETVDLLLAAGAVTTLRDYVFHCTPRAFGICVPASWGILPLVQHQLEQDPALAKINDGRGTPLHEAARGGHAAIVQLLIKHGADVNARDSEGKTPAELANDRGHADVVKLLGSG